MPLTPKISETNYNELLLLSQDGLNRFFARVFLLGLAGLLFLYAYPLPVILTWYAVALGLALISLNRQKALGLAQSESLAQKVKTSWQFIMVSWAESTAVLIFIILMANYEGPQTHFLPFLLLICSSIHVAGSTYENAILMFGHLSLYCVALLFITITDVAKTYPNTDGALIVQFFISCVAVVFLIDTYLFFYRIYRERRQQSEKLHDAFEHAKALSLQKSDLISAIGHELRTPLNGILGFSKVIKRTELTKKQKEYIDLIEGAGKDLHLLLSNILDSETLEQGQFHLHPTLTDIPGLLHRTLKIFEVTAATKGIYLKLKVEDGFPAQLLIDDTRLGQCVANLLSNAVRFTENGGITVKAGFKNGDIPKLSIRVIDTGIGIPKDQSRRIFEKFGQGKHQKISQGGTGLGLWLVQSIAGDMNGSLTLHSTSEKGSEFRLEFQLAPHASTPETNVAGLAGKRVLHIEDIETNLMLVRFLLEEHSMIITEARTGQHAIELLKTSDFDIIICDLHLPDCDGNQVLKDIRNLDNANAHIPVIALTAQPEKVSSAKVNGNFMAILSKPVDHQTLMSTLAKLR